MPKIAKFDSSAFLDKYVMKQEITLKALLTALIYIYLSYGGEGVRFKKEFTKRILGKPTESQNVYSPELHPKSTCRKGP